MGEGESTALTGNISRSNYYTMVKFLKPAITSQSRWNELFPRDEDKQQQYWSAIYRNPYKAVRDTKLQAFHFRIVHRFLPCNAFQKKIRIRRDDQCSFCRIHKNTFVLLPKGVDLLETGDYLVCKRGRHSHQCLPKGLPFWSTQRYSECNSDQLYPLVF